MYTLRFSIRNRSRAQLLQLQQWIESALKDWDKDKEIPMKGTTYVTSMNKQGKKRKT